MEQEDPTESIREDLHHQATHGAHATHGADASHAAPDRFPLVVALAAALLAALAAVTSLLSGRFADEAMIEQIQASDAWNLYQAKSIKSALLESKGELLVAVGKAPRAEDAAHLATYAKELEEASRTAGERQASYRSHIERHHALSRGVTLYQVAIALAAIAVLTRRRRFFYVALSFGAVGLFFTVQGLL